MDIEKIKECVNKYPLIAYPALALLALAVVSFILTTKQKNYDHKTAYTASQKPNDMSLPGSKVQEKIRRLEDSDNDFEDKFKAMEKKLKSLEKSTKGLKKDIISAMDASLSKKLDHLSQIQAAVPTTDDTQLVSVDIQPIEDKDAGDSVYLPLGSFCKGTLLTGVYAAADQNNPLPVLISLDEAFYGPNQSRIPLKGAFVLGKAYGDLVSQRALIQIIAISSVLPNSVTFENEQNLGYVTDAFGELGIRGQLIRNTGGQLATTFMSGFLSGGSQALADQETSVRTTNDGDTIKTVTGNGGKQAIFQGLAQSAGKLSDYYAKQTEDLIPAIHIRNGQTIYFIVQKGVTINGLTRLNLASGRISD